jgi:hypothetical protein
MGMLDDGVPGVRGGAGRWLLPSPAPVLGLSGRLGAGAGPPWAATLSTPRPPTRPLVERRRRHRQHGSPGSGEMDVAGPLAAAARLGDTDTAPP